MDVVDGKHMSFFARSADAYEAVCTQLHPLVKQLNEKNAYFHSKQEHKCRRYVTNQALCLFFVSNAQMSVPQ
jgi:hypothetical protein